MNDIQKRNNIVNNFVNLANFTKHKVPPFGADINENQYISLNCPKLPSHLLFFANSSYLHAHGGKNYIKKCKISEIIMRFTSKSEREKFLSTKRKSKVQLPDHTTLCSKSLISIELGSVFCVRFCFDFLARPSKKHQKLPFLGIYLAEKSQIT